MTGTLPADQSPPPSVSGLKDRRAALDRLMAAVQEAVMRLRSVEKYAMLDSSAIHAGLERLRKRGRGRGVAGARYVVHRSPQEPPL